MFKIKNKTPITILGVPQKSDVLNVLYVEEDDVVFYDDLSGNTVSVVYVGDTVKMKAPAREVLSCVENGSRLNCVDAEEIPRCALPNALYYRYLNP